MTWQEFEFPLRGGHPNSLGNTVAVVEQVLADRHLLDDLLDTYASDDEVVRLRVSNALKRIAQAKPRWVHEKFPRLIDQVSEIDQASTHWTLAQVFLELQDLLSLDERDHAVALLKRNLERFDDWIVLNQTLETLGQWARNDAGLRDWVMPHLVRLAGESRKSIAGRARKHLGILSG